MTDHDSAVTAAELDERLKPQYPTYLDDTDGLALFRDEVLRNRGHDMANVNHNSLGRLLDTIAALRRERDEARACHHLHDALRRHRRGE